MKGPCLVLGLFGYWLAVRARGSIILGSNLDGRLDGKNPQDQPIEVENFVCHPAPKFSDFFAYFSMPLGPSSAEIIGHLDTVHQPGLAAHAMTIPEVVSSRVGDYEYRVAVRKWHEQLDRLIGLVLSDDRARKAALPRETIVAASRYISVPPYKLPASVDYFIRPRPFEGFCDMREFVCKSALPQQQEPVVAMHADANTSSSAASPANATSDTAESPVSSAPNSAESPINRIIQGEDCLVRILSFTGIYLGLARFVCRAFHRAAHSSRQLSVSSIGEYFRCRMLELNGAALDMTFNLLIKADLPFYKTPRALPKRMDDLAELARAIDGPFYVLVLWSSSLVSGLPEDLVTATEEMFLRDLLPPTQGCLQALNSLWTITLRNHSGNAGKQRGAAWRLIRGFFARHASHFKSVGLPPDDSLASWANFTGFQQ